LLPQSWGKWALAKYPYWTPDLVREIAQKFRNHWVAKTGRDATKLDWYATWQNWCSSDITQREYPPPANQRTPADAAARAERIARLAGYTQGEIIDAGS
jgi:hypothetical protein